MITASHLLAGYLAGSFLRSRYCRDPAPRNPLRDPVIVVAAMGSVLPDWDVLPGLLGGYSLVGFHRGFTHSPAGVLVQAVALAGVVYYALRRFLPADGSRSDRSWRVLFLAALAGLATHAVLDALNTWGVALYSPFSRAGVSANLLHEGDLFFLAVLLIASLLVGSGRQKAGYLVAALLLPSYLLFQLSWRHQVTLLAERELPGQRVQVYPNTRLSCRWLVLSGTAEQLGAHCLSLPGAATLTTIKSVPIPTAPEIQATVEAPEVRSFVRRRQFPFPEIHARPNGETLVVWRDLREALIAGDEPHPAGLYVSLGPGGEILSIRHQWLLRFWYW